MKLKKFNSITLYDLIKKIYSGLIVVVVDNILENLIEAIYRFLIIRGKDYNSLEKYTEVLDYYFNLLKQTEFDIGIPDLRNTYIKELLGRG